MRFTKTAALALLASVAAAALDPTHPAQPVKLVFVHHSCGTAWLSDSHGELALELMDNNYFVSDTNYGWGPNTIGSSTDIGHWWTWFRNPSTAATVTAALYAQSSKESTYTRLANDPGGENEIIMFKSCYPNSGFKEDSSTSVPSIADNNLKGQACGSSYHTVPNAKGIYIDLLENFEQHQEKLFVVITAPPLVSSDAGARAREFNNWLVHDWLDGYQHNNVAVFDFFNVLTAENAHHRLINGAVQHVFVSGENLAAYPSSASDSHPNAEGDKKATSEFVPLLNAFYNAWAFNSTYSGATGGGGSGGDDVGSTASTTTTTIAAVLGAVVPALVQF